MVNFSVISLSYNNVIISANNTNIVKIRNFAINILLFLEKGMYNENFNNWLWKHGFDLRSVISTVPQGY